MLTPGFREFSLYTIKDLSVCMCVHTHAQVCFTPLVMKTHETRKSRRHLSFFSKTLCLNIPIPEYHLSQAAVSLQCVRTGLLPAEECFFLWLVVWLRHNWVVRGGFLTPSLDIKNYSYTVLHVNDPQRKQQKDKLYSSLNSKIKISFAFHEIIQKRM